MRVLRIILAGLVAVAALAAGFFVIALVVLAGLAAFLIQMFWRRSRSRPAGAPEPTARRGGRIRADDAIDIDATDVPPDPPRG